MIFIKIRKTITEKWANKKAVTLIELLVWIWIISILALWMSSINFNRLNSKQKLELFTNSIKINYEEIRNNALAWKWIWTDLEVPKKWKIDYSMNNSWTIITSKLSSNWIDWEIFNGNNWIVFQSGYYISNIKCFKSTWEEENELLSTLTWTIEFEWINIKLWWNCNSGSRILELKIKNKTDEKILKINTLNWLIETK